MSMIERAARALAKAQSGVDEFDALDEGMQETLKENVRAVVEAMREPSEEMSFNGSLAAPFYVPEGLPDAPTQAAKVWQAMIDAALAGEE